MVASVQPLTAGNAGTGPDVASRVRAQLERDYPAGALGWVDGLKWSGPSLVPVSQIDRTAGDWSASEDTQKVNSFARRIQAGWKKPVVAIRRPGTSLLYLVDGHTRATAAAKVGQPVTAYIGTSPAARGPWMVTHHKQLAGDPSGVIDLVGPKGYVHGWHYVGPQAVGAKVFHPGLGTGTVTGHDGKTVKVRFNVGGERSFGAKPGKGAGRLEKHAATPVAPAPAPAPGKLANAAVMDKTRLAAMSGDQLKAVDAEMSRRAAALGHAGKVSGTHKAVRAELAKRAGPSRRPAKAAPAARAPAPPAKSLAGYQEWRDNLTPAEDKAMRFYQSPGFALMNGQLRGLDAEKLKSAEHATDSDLKRARQASQDLTKAIAKAPPLTRDTTVYRGFDASQFGKLTPGQVITDKGFTSTAITNDAGAVGRAGSRGQSEILLPKGTRAAAGSSRELVLPPGSSFRVVDVRVKGGVTYTKLELIPKGQQHANSADAVELSARTGMLSVTPAPYGKPDGTGLYGVKGNKHSDYFEQLVQALMRKRGMDKARASKVAWGVLRRWARGGGSVRPEVRAAAARALAQEAAASARSHAHSNPPEDAVTVELAGAFNSALHPRVGAGNTGGGRFAPKNAAAQPAAGKQPDGGREKAPHAVTGRKAQVRQLRDRARALRGQARILDARAHALAAAHPASKAASARASKAAKAKVKKNLPVKHRTKTSKTAKKSAPSIASQVTSLRTRARILRTRAGILDIKAKELAMAGTGPAVELAVKTPAPERAAGRRKLAAKGDALPDGADPIPDLDYLKRAIKSVGRLDPSKRPALKKLIRKRARELGALNAPGVKGTWAFEGASDGAAIGLAAMTRTPRVRGASDVQTSRTAPGKVTVTHKPTGMKVGTLEKGPAGWLAVHATGKTAGPARSMAACLSGLIGLHNRVAKSVPSMAPAGRDMANGEQLTLDLAGALPYTSSVTSSDGPRVTKMSAAKGATKSTPAAASMSAEVKKVYAKLLKRGMKPAQAMALAKRAAAMHAKATAKAA